MAIFLVTTIIFLALWLIEKKKTNQSKKETASAIDENEQLAAKYAKVIGEKDLLVSKYAKIIDADAEAAGRGAGIYPHSVH